MRRAVLVLLVAAVGACGHSRYGGPVAVHATIEIQSWSSTAGGTCQGTNGLVGYQVGRQLTVVDQDSKIVASPALPPGVRSLRGCDFHLTVTLPKGDQSLWLPMSELGVGCRSSHRGALIFDRSTISGPAVNAVLGLPSGHSTKTGHCT